MSLIPFSTGDNDNPGFVERLKQLVFPDLEPENLQFPHARFIQNGLVIAQTFVDCLRNNNVNFYSKSDVSVGCNIASFNGPPRSRIQAVYAFKSGEQCKRRHYTQHTVGKIMCYAEQHASCRKCNTENDIFNEILTGTEFCNQSLAMSEKAFLCAEKIFAKGSGDKLYLGPMWPCDYKIAIHWEGIKYKYADSDLIADDEDLLDVIALHLQGERALRIDRDLPLHEEIMRKSKGPGDWGGTFWQRLSDMQHRCREERRIRKRFACEAIFDDNAISGMEAAPAVDQSGIQFNVPCSNPPSDNQYCINGECFDCFTPVVLLTANTAAIGDGESVNLSWSSTVPDKDTSVVTIEYGNTIIPVTRNQSSSMAFTPSETTTYTIRAVTECGTVTKTVTVTVSDALPCACPTTPSCLFLDDVSASVMCLTGDDSGAPAWDWKLSKTTDCVWELPFGVASVAGKAFSAIVTLISCSPYVYRLTLLTRSGGKEAMIWQGTTQDSPLGNYNRDTGCDPSVIAVNNCPGTTCGDGPTITFDPPSGSTVVFPTTVFIHASQSDALVFYTLDGSEPNDNGTEYTGPFTLSAGQVLRAVAYTSDGCIGEPASADYHALEGFAFEFICDGPQDKAGVFGEFAPNGEDNDYHWRIIIQRDNPWTLKTMEVYETNPSGIWVTGQAWATLNPAFPAEMNGHPFSIYPTVIFKDGAQLNFAYATDLALPFNGGEVVTLDCYGQPFVALTGYFRLLWTFTENGNTVVVRQLIPHSCYGY